MVALTYPYAPKSAVTLTAGEFWAIPLRDGTFAAGRVMQATPRRPEASRVIFLAGLMDWHGESLPTSESLAQSKCIAQGKTHIKCIHATGGSILGIRPLELDKLKPQKSLSGLGEPEGLVMRGLDHVRRAAFFDRYLPQLSVWGIEYPRSLAENKFLSSNES